MACRGPCAEILSVGRLHSCIVGGKHGTGRKAGKNEIPVWLIAAGGILSASLGYFHGKIPLVLMVTGALVGGVFLLISRLTQEAFGYGDSLMIAVTGVYLGFWNVLYLLVWAYVLAAVFAGYVLIRKGFQKDAAFPFVRFLLAAYIGIVCLGGI